MAVLLALLAQLPPALTRDGAREAAREELRKPIYQQAEPSPVERAAEWLFDRLQRLVADAAASVPGGGGGLVALIVILVLVGLLVRRGLGRRPSRGGFDDSRVGAARRTADDYRREGAELAARGELKEALRARFRALVRELEQRGVLDPRPGRTAGEIAREAGATVPAVAPDVRAAAALFDEVWYGDRPATAESYARLVALDDRVAATRLAATVGT